MLAIWESKCRFKGNLISVSNGSGLPTSSPGLDHKHGSVLFKFRPATESADSWQASPGAGPVIPQVSPGLARPVGSNLWFCISGFTLMVAFRYCIVNCKMSILVRHG